MPKFNLHLPRTQSDIKNDRVNNKFKKTSLPIGVIGGNLNFSYGFDGLRYYVTEGILEQYITRIHLNFDEAKNLFDALTFEAIPEPCSKLIGILIKSARKNKIKEADLFWYFVDGLNN